MAQQGSNDWIQDLYGGNRAKVVHNPDCSLARNLGYSQESAYRLNGRFNLYVNLRISNHNQTFSNALNVLLAFSHTRLSFYKQGFHFLSFLLQLLFSCGGAQIWILRESFVERVGTLLRVHIDKLIAPRRHNELTVNRTAPGCEKSGAVTPSQPWHGFSV